MEVVGSSVGGGNILITEIDGLAVELTGEYPTLLIRHHDIPGVITEVTRILAGNSINVAFMQVFRHSRGEDAYMVIETDQKVPPEVQEDIIRLCPDIRQVRVV
ncbi:L-serine dehydratase, beta chain [bioreactor metagenome]|uniref:L-serine dehydratase, beta chain n=1 Tax=bioreactor metagenome TaxID=1076179 RepID=A0A645JES1_9ZZZZ